MTISSQWLAFGAIGIVLFLVGIAWPKDRDCHKEERVQDPQLDGERHQDSHRRGAAALASSR